MAKLGRSTDEWQRKRIQRGQFEPCWPKPLRGQFYRRLPTKKGRRSWSSRHPANQTSWFLSETPPLTQDDRSSQTHQPLWSVETRTPDRCIQEFIDEAEAEYDPTERDEYEWIADLIDQALRAIERERNDDDQ